MNKITINIPSIPDKAEFPLIFLIIFLPAYLAQTAMPAGVFDYPVYHGQAILQSLLIFLLTIYLMRKDRTPEALSAEDPGSKVFQGAFAEEIRLTHILISLTGLGLIYGVYILILGFIVPPPESEPVLITKGVMLLPSLVTCLSAAAMEEFFFRGYGYFRLRQSGFRPVSSIVMINILFSLGHLYEGIPAALFAFGSGLFLGFMVLKRISLFSLSAAHGIFNFLMILLSYLTGKGSL